jgi:hypothetical protein
MSDILDGNSIGKEPSRSTESEFVAQLGRISGKALQSNLVRNGADLTFRNGATDPDLLYLDVNSLRIGINKESPSYNLHVDTTITTNRLIADNSRIDNILISGSQFSTVVGPINIVPSGPNPLITLERLITSDLEFNNNSINSFDSSNINLDASGTGTVNFQVSDQSTTKIYADLGVSGNINLDGNLSKQGNIIIGDEITDIIIINTDFAQSIIPGDNLSYNLGTPLKRWDAVFSSDLSNVDTILPQIANISNQLRLDGINSKITSLQSNDDIVLSSGTGAVILEKIKWQDSDITNLLDSPLTIISS